MPGHSKMAAAATAAAAQVDHKFKYSPASYRVVLSDDSIDNDIVVEVTAAGAAEAGKFTPVANVDVYSKKAYEADAKKRKLPITCVPPEMPVRFAETHCLGLPYEGKPDTLNRRKFTLNLQSKFEENFGVEINRRHHEHPRDKQVYDDINEEIHWYCGQLLKLQRKIARAIWDFEGAFVDERASFLTSAKVAVAAARHVPNHEVKSTDSDVIEQAFEMFLKQSYIAQAVHVDKELSTPDTCPMLGECMGDICTHDEHKRGKPEYIVSARCRIFRNIHHDHKNPKATPPVPQFASDAMDADWEKANPGRGASLDPKVKRLLMDQFACDMMAKKGLVCEPVFYRARQFSTVSMTKKEALERNPAPKLLFFGPHKQVLGFGHTVSVPISISASAYTTKKGVGMRIKFFPTEILIVAQQKLSFTRDRGDEVLTCDDNMDFGDMNYDLGPVSGDKRAREPEPASPPPKKPYVPENPDFDAPFMTNE